MTHHRMRPRARLDYESRPAREGPQSHAASFAFAVFAAVAFVVVVVVTFALRSLGVLGIDVHMNP